MERYKQKFLKEEYEPDEFTIEDLEETLDKIPGVKVTENSLNKVYHTGESYKNNPIVVSINKADGDLAILCRPTSGGVVFLSKRYLPDSTMYDDVAKSVSEKEYQTVVNLVKSGTSISQEVK